MTRVLKRDLNCRHLAMRASLVLAASLVLTLCPGGDLAFLLQSRYTDAKKKEDRKFNPLPESVVKFYGTARRTGGGHTAQEPSDGRLARRVRRR